MPPRFKRTPQVSESLGSAAIDKQENNLAKKFSLDGLVALVSVFFLAVAHMSIPLMCLIWAILTGAVLHFVYNLPFTLRLKPAKPLVIIVIGCLMIYSAYDSVMEKLTAGEIKEEEEGARVEIETVTFVDVGKSNVAFPTFSFDYKNNGHLTALGVRRWFAFQSIDGRPLTDAEIKDVFKDLESKTYTFNASDQIPAGDSGFFNEPREKGDEQKAMDSALPDVRSGKSLLYLMEVTWYRDRLTPSHRVKVSEFCVAFNKDLIPPHFYRQNIVHTEKY